MTKLFKDPFVQNLFDFRKEFDQVFHRFFGTTWTQESLQPMVGFVPPVEAFIDNKTQKFFLRIALPGIKPEELKLNLVGNVLTLCGERKLMPEMESVDFLHREFHFGPFERTLNLPEGVDADRLIAEYKNGILELTAPVISAGLSRRIEVKMPVEVKKAVV